MAQKDMSIQKLEYAALQIRKNLLKLCSMQNIHIGGDLSIADIMTALWQYQIHFDSQNPREESRDRFILSKGHASAVTAFNQAAIGCFNEKAIFDEYASDSGRFSMHSCNLRNPYVEVSTGSLGHGMPVACGIAAALRLKGNKHSRVYTVMGDGEQSEGSVWEAAMNAAHYQLGNLIVIIDYNGLESDGSIHAITGIENLADKYSSFGWNINEIDGNDMISVKKAFDGLPDAEAIKPTALICHTVKGKGVDFMENQVRWHAGKISPVQRDEAIQKLEAVYMQKWGRQDVGF